MIWGLLIVGFTNLFVGLFRLEGSNSFLTAGLILVALGFLLEEK